jgi:hypothetical protein
MCSAEPADDFELLLGRLLTVDAVDADFPADAFGDGVAIAGYHRDVTDPFGAESLDDPIGVWSQLVGHHDHTAEVAVDADEHVRLA